MFSLDDYLATFSDGAPTVVVVVVAALLGLRHATDPDHLAAVATLVAGDRKTAVRDARTLGLAWGLGHALSLMALGIPIVVFRAFLPEGLVQAAEVLIGILVVALSVRVLVRWQRGYWHVHAHDHDDDASHVHPHAHAAEDSTHAHEHPRPRARTPLGAFAVGLVHGVGGSAGVGLLLLASIDSLALGLGALIFFAGFTAVSMTFISDGVGRALASASSKKGAFRVALPALAVLTFAFGVYYEASALGPLSGLL